MHLPTISNSVLNKIASVLPPRGGRSPSRAPRVDDKRSCSSGRICRLGGHAATAYPTGGQASAPCRQSCRASAQHRPTRAPVAGKRSSLSKFDPIHEQWQRRYSPKRRPPSCRPKATLPRNTWRDWVTTRSRGKDYSFRGKSPPRPPPSPQGDDICNCNRRRDDRPNDRVKTRSPSRVPSATSRRHVELSSTRTSSWAGMRLLPARRQVAGVPHWHAQRLLTQRRGDTAVAPALGASAQGVPAPSGFLVLKTLTESTAPCSPGSSASSRGHGPFGCPGRQCPLRWPACLGVSSL